MMKCSAPKDRVVLICLVGLVTLATLTATLFLPSVAMAIDDAYTKSSMVGSENYEANNTSSISLIVGELESIATSNLTRISVTNPDIADIVEAVTGQVDIIGKSAGETTLFIWDDNGKQQITIRVSEQELKAIKERAEKIFAKSGLSEISVDLDEQEGKVILTGEYPEYKEELLASIVDAFGETVINLTKKEVLTDMIQIEMQVAEVSASFSKEMGFDWGTNLIDSQSSAGADTDLFLVYDEEAPPVDGSPQDWFKIGQFSRAFSLQTRLNLILEEGKGRILSRPKVLVTSGEEAKLLVGGQIPIRTSTASTEGSTVTENVSFKEYGVGMTMTPTIQRGKINIVLNVTISDIDRANAVGDDVAFTTRDASTNLNLDDGQTVVIGGLIKHDTGETLTKVPFLADIPILGLLYRNRSIPSNQDLEVIISLTPTIMASADAASSRQGLSENKALSQRKLQAAEKESQTDVFVAPKDTMNTTLNMAAQSAPTPQGMGDYIESVQKRIAASIVYPQQAKEQRWEGTVRLAMLILNDGTLAHASVRESSGHDVIDEYALNTAKNIAPYAGFPTNVDLQEISVTIPIVYSLKNR